MDIFHTHAKATTMQLVNRVADIHKLAREICFKFGVKVLSHNDHINEALDPNHLEYAGWTAEENQNYKEARLRYDSKVLLAYPNGVPFGVISIEKVTKNGQVSDLYNFSSHFVSKDRGRGDDRQTRKSSTILNLLKAIAKDCHLNSETEGFKSVFTRCLLEDIHEEVKSSFKIPHVGLLRDDASEALVNFYKHNKLITDPSTLKDIDNYAQKVIERNAKLDELQAAVNRFKTEVYMLCTVSMSPAIVVGKIKYEGGLNNWSVESVQSYASVDDVPPELMLTYKMWRTKHETKYDFSEELLPRRTDYDPDFEVVPLSRTHRGMSHFDVVRTLVTPVIETTHVN